MGNGINRGLKGRAFKKKVLEILQEPDREKRQKLIGSLPPRRVINPLIGYLCNPIEIIKWRSVDAIADVMDDLAHHEFESARVIMRRLMWSLNDESGGIGWGAPEAMGAAMALNDKLALEYHRILTAMIMPEAGYIEHEGLQQGILWGIGRLCHGRPELLQYIEKNLKPFLKSETPDIRGLATWALSGLKSRALRSILKPLVNDYAQMKLYLDNELKTCTVGMIARSGISAENSCEWKQTI